MYILESLSIKNIISFKDVTFTFKKGKPILMVGKNLDDPSQEGNGSGKSGFIEAVALAFSGSPIRDVLTKELIYNGEKDGELELTMFNPVTNIRFKIWRKLYANTKSAEYQCWINGVDQCERYSDFNGFNAFVWKTVGISKEDFFSFYLITRDEYKPFFQVGDTKKKEIINRFSGADKVDVAFPDIEKDSEALGLQLAQIERELLTCTTKQELIAGQMVEEENKVSVDEKNKVIAGKEVELEKLYEDAHLIDLHIADNKKGVQLAKDELTKFESESGADLTPLENNVTLAKEDVANFKFKKEYETLFAEYQKVKNGLDADKVEKNKELPLVKLSFKAEIDAIIKEEEEIKTQLTTDRATLKEYEQFESDVNKKLQDAIECPKCSHKFSLRDKEFNVQEAQEALPGVMEEIKTLKELITVTVSMIDTDIQESKNAVNEKIVKAGDTIRKAIEEINLSLVACGKDEYDLKKEYQIELNEKKELDNKLLNAQSALKNKKDSLENQTTILKNKLRRAEITLQQSEAEYKSNQENINSLNIAIEKLNNQEVDKTRLQDLETKFMALATEEEDIKTRMDAKRKEKEKVDAWKINFLNFKSHLANCSIKNIEDYTNLFLNSTGSNLAVSIDGYKTLSNKKISEKISTNVLRDGFDAGSYGKFSGGERARMDLAAILSLQELIQLNANGNGLDLLIADEILESVDSVGMEHIINSLATIDKTIMIVSQNEVQALAGQTIIIQKQNKVSTILN